MHIEWKYLDVPAGSQQEKMAQWPGKPEEEIMICVHKGKEIREMFHRHDFFFFNFAHKGDYGALSYKYDNHITIHEGECYIGQPFSGYALYGQSEFPACCTVKLGNHFLKSCWNNAWNGKRHY